MTTVTLKGELIMTTITLSLALNPDHPSTSNACCSQCGQPLYEFANEDRTLILLTCLHSILSADLNHPPVLTA